MIVSANFDVTDCKPLNDVMISLAGKSKAHAAVRSLDERAKPQSGEPSEIREFIAICTTAPGYRTARAASRRAPPHPGYRITH
jgi:hypothetical protein